MNRCPSLFHGEPGDPYGCGDGLGPAHRLDLGDYVPWHLRSPYRRAYDDAMLRFDEAIRRLGWREVRR